MENLFEIHRKCMECHGLVRNLKEVGYGNWKKLKKNVWEPMNLEKVRETCGKLNKSYSSKNKIEE